ncbi:MAG: PA2779 family protein [Thiomonas sp.]|uniref:PA2779 family protein n=1 Tax=Thiomonas sp. TaxID=2047785 RepID=UPI002A36C8D6|nr:PA2779 family protein [Thiomonas sp.]MDY0330326.1 PA2779 family protein [Thiomonas sp.]
MFASRISRQFLVAALGVSLMAAAPAARAELIGTQQLTQPQSGQGAATLAKDRATLDHFMARADVQAKLEQMGLSQEVTQQRLAALSNAEVAQLAARIDNMPAAGSLSFQEMVIILLVAILVVLAL